MKENNEGIANWKEREEKDGMKSREKEEIIYSMKEMKRKSGGESMSGER